VAKWRDDDYDERNSRFHYFIFIIYNIKYKDYTVHVCQNDYKSGYEEDAEKQGKIDIFN
jgi:hypothetical protein